MKADEFPAVWVKAIKEDPADETDHHIAIYYKMVEATLAIPFALEYKEDGCSY